MAVLSLENVLAAVEDLKREIGALKAEVATLKARDGVAPASAGATPAEAGAAQEVSEEVLVMLAAAATTFLGKKVRVRSAKMLQTPYEIVNPWAQHGRVFIQASHQLQRGR
ncbi:hypothetical protein [Telmatospirillum siberiense]|uniref:Uncharacterized protein n=1 Tax=Telmatospirillum siberiense TaxID=382514 RepID=A0A2N3PM10_9PROT|nr:hypothetical protein [Telmatospirillum siberiense]PKU21449.1 hypothetical protein CWS72_26730 [Telmatospirillum siberiense]